MAKNAPEAVFKVVYEGKDITSDLTSTLLTITYSDKTEDESDEVTIKVEDVARLWQNSWQPNKGDKINIRFGYSNKTIGSGDFEVDELTMSGPPDVVTIKAISTGVTMDLKTGKSRTFTGQTLAQIAGQIAVDQNLTIVGEVPHLVINFVTQNNETDLGFLHRIGKKFGIMFSVRGSQLVFTTRKDIDESPKVVSIDRTEISRYNFTIKSDGTYSMAKASYSDPDTGEVVEAEAGYLGLEPVSTDTLVVLDRLENKAQAELVAESELHEANSLTCTGNITIEGNPYIVAGNNIELTGFGKYTGVFQVLESSHTINKSGGYSTKASLKRVEVVDDSGKQTPKVVLETLDIANPQGR